MTATVMARSIDETISDTALKYGVSEALMRSIINCESGYKTDIQSRYVDRFGNREQSFGIAQINLPSWPEVTKAQALDPYFSIDFLGKKLSTGGAHFWSCYNQQLAVKK